MASNRKFSKDPKVKLISIEDFYETNGYLVGVDKEKIWKTKTKPKHSDILFKFTPQFLICTVYGFYFTNYGMDINDKLEFIYVAIRDGKNEYELLDSKLSELKEERANHKKSKKLDEEIERIEKVRKLLPKYKVIVLPEVKPFESYLIDTGYKTSIETLNNKYLVFDVETNGLRTASDDLLSLSIYDPSTGICYNRFFPLDLQPLVLTGFINGIKDETLHEATHMSQEEMNWLIDYFHMNERILLSFSGGDGTFDLSFVKNYCKRHKICGFDDLKFENIKSKIPRAPYGSEGQLTKDNLCRMFDIEGVSKIHSSFNDCILEWKLFEKLESECVFFINRHLYRYTPEYIIPYSYLYNHKELAKFAGVEIPILQGKATEIFKLEFPNKILNEIKKFPTNITGITIEHGLNTFLNAEEQDNLLFLANNKSHLQYVGSLDSRIKEIPIMPEDDGTVKAIKEEDKAFIDEVNSVTKKIIDYIKPVADYLRENIFKEDKIMTQELAVSNDGKVLALCDLSDSKNVVEIKTTRVFETGEETYIFESIARQLYYQSKGRNTYLLSIKFDTHINNKTYKDIVDNLNIYLYKVELLKYDPKTMVKEFKLPEIYVDTLKIIIESPCIAKKVLAKELGIYLSKIVNKILNTLEVFGYIKKEDPTAKISPWLVLRSIDDISTKYTEDENGIHIIYG